MASILELRCTVCQRTYQPGEVEYFCPACGQVGTLDVLYDYDALRESLNRAVLADFHESSMWRYRDLLPVGLDTVVPPLRVGFSPLLDAPRLADEFGGRRLWVKDDGQNPTASLKDRASTMVVARAIEQSRRVVSTASTGNAAAALSGICASVPDMQAIIFVPAAAPEAKIA